MNIRHRIGKGSRESNATILHLSIALIIQIEYVHAMKSTTAKQFVFTVLLGPSAHRLYISQIFPDPPSVSFLFFSTRKMTTTGLHQAEGHSPYRGIEVEEAEGSGIHEEQERQGMAEVLQGTQDSVLGNLVQHEHWGIPSQEAVDIRDRAADLMEQSRRKVHIRYPGTEVLHVNRVLEEVHQAVRSRVRRRMKLVLGNESRLRPECFLQDILDGPCPYPSSCPYPSYVSSLHLPNPQSRPPSHTIVCPFCPSCPSSLSCSHIRRTCLSCPSPSCFRTRRTCRVYPSCPSCLCDRHDHACYRPVVGTLRRCSDWGQMEGEGIHWEGNCRMGKDGWACWGLDTRQADAKEVRMVRRSRAEVLDMLRTRCHLGVERDLHLVHHFLQKNDQAC